MYFNGFSHTYSINKYGTAHCVIRGDTQVEFSKLSCISVHSPRGLPVGFILLPCSVYVLFSPNLCFISFLYLDLYVPRDDAWVRWGSSMRAGHLCVLVRILAGGGVGAVGPV